MAASRVNLLGLPKRKEFLQNFIAPPGWEVAQWDCTALEPHVLCQLSQDKNMMKIYGPGAKHQCIYLYTAYHVPMLSKVKDHYSLDGYGSSEELDAVKAIVYKERKFMKPGYLGWCYGLTAHGLARDTGMPIEEASVVMRCIDQTFPGKDRLQNALVAQWKANGGWVVNPRGRPMCVPKSKIKDLVSRQCQAGGHDLLMRILWHLNNYRKKHKIKMKSYIPDWHDESVMLIRPEERIRYTEATDYAFDRLNDELQWDVVIKHGGVSYGADVSIRCD